MIHNYTLFGWSTTSSNILIDNHISVKGGLKVIDCIAQSAEYWHPNGTKQGFGQCPVGQ